MSELDFPTMVFEVSDFVAIVNQTLEHAYPSVTIRGEIANFRISKNKWVYFDLKDTTASVRFFGTVYQLSGPLEDGLMLRVRGVPRLHAQYGFSVTILSIHPEGEGTIRRMTELLVAKLAAEGLFIEERKRMLPCPPDKIGLITSLESAAYADFMKILGARFGGVLIECIDTQVQGEIAPMQIVAAIERFNASSEPPDVLVLIRGGGSAEDLHAYSTEQVARAVATSRVPTLVAIGHEVDTSLAEMAADRRASTPSNAAEILVPDRADLLRALESCKVRLHESTLRVIRMNRQRVTQCGLSMAQALELHVMRARERLEAQKKLLDVLNPKAVMKRGFAIVRLANNVLVRSQVDVRTDDMLHIELSSGDRIVAIAQKGRRTHGNSE